MSDVNDLGDVFVCHQMVEEGHLAVDVAYGSRPGLVRQELRQRPVAHIEIESRRQTALMQVKVREQPREHPRVVAARRQW
jgi:hypothetical protein